ncbi:MAG TPA: tetratricopeptide repeat protein [Methylomirabilota bacterium]|nr:tetratricopeptide repeat protein [Methylomirabilota bacterium]
MPQVSVPDALRLAQRHRDAGRFRDAESIYREILAQRPDHAESHHQLGLLANDGPMTASCGCSVVKSAGPFAARGPPLSSSVETAGASRGRIG